MNIAKLLKVRATKKAKKPKFTAQAQNKINKLKRKGWRKPKGIHSKMRHGFKGYKRCVRVGWGSPVLVKGLHKTGLEMVVVHTVESLVAISPDKQGILLGSSVGTKKRLEILEAAIAKKITVINVKDPRKFIEDAKSRITKAKEEKQKKKDKKSKKDEKTKKTIDEKVEESDDDKKTKEAREAEKALIKERK
jgi:large subunit ribosomal protein L32e